MIDGFAVLQQFSNNSVTRQNDIEDVLARFRPKTYVYRIFDPEENFKKNYLTLKIGEHIKEPIALAKHSQVLKNIESLKNNWDGQGAVIPDTTIIQKVKNFLSVLPNQFLEELDEEYIFPNPNGTISIEWRNEFKNNAVSIEFGQETANYFICIDSAYDGEENIRNIDTDIPTKLISSISKII